MLDKFSKQMACAPFDFLKNVNAIAVGVSGGPDSLALLKLLSDWSDQNNGPDIHAITVDHGLRPEAADEAASVKKAVQDWPKVKHQILTWDGEKPDSAIQEEARAMRYSLMSDYCSKHSISHLFLAHHADDQIETFLFRLAKGSGLDGLSAIKAVQDRADLKLCRPLLDHSKEELMEYCRQVSIPFIHDPSNDKDDFARIRLRKLVAGLEGEGLSFKRVNTTIDRLQRAREALELLSSKSFDNSVSTINTDRIEFNFDTLIREPFEIVFRVLQKGMNHIAPNDGYGVRTERLENLVSDLVSDEKFRKRTLGGVVFSLSKDSKSFILEKEHNE